MSYSFNIHACKLKKHAQAVVLDDFESLHIIIHKKMFLQKLRLLDIHYHYRFIEELNTFDDQQMAESTLVLVEPYLKKTSFDPESLEKKSNNTACAGLCRWVHGVVK